MKASGGLEVWKTRVFLYCIAIFLNHHLQFVILLEPVLGVGDWLAILADWCS
jgi:hypothetical protein